MTYSGLANQVRISDQSSSRNGTPIDTFLIHHQAGTSDDAVIAAMISGAREVSANYTISNEGRITCVVPEELRAWTSGSSQDGGKGAQWDRRSVTVEIENQAAGGDWPWSEEAYRSAAALLQDLRKRYGVSIVLGHRDLWERYRASYATFCPGPGKVDRVVAISGGAPITLPPPVAGGGSSDDWDFGGSAGTQAWTGLQLWLAREWGYTGIIDGIPGKLTWTALQKYLKTSWSYSGIIDGLPGPLSWSAAQRWLKAKHGYTGIIDGEPGPLTYAALGRAGGVQQSAPPAGLPRTAIDGRPGVITWTRGQTWLKRDWGYTGIIDGIPGPITWRSFQRFLAAHWDYTGPIDGDPGKYTYSAMQRWLKAQWGYTGPIDGDPGIYTWSAYQRFVNTI